MSMFQKNVKSSVRKNTGYTYSGDLSYCDRNIRGYHWDMKKTVKKGMQNEMQKAKMAICTEATENFCSRSMQFEKYTHDSVQPSELNRRRDER